MRMARSLSKFGFSGKIKSHLTDRSGHASTSSNRTHNSYRERGLQRQKENSSRRPNVEIIRFYFVGNTCDVLHEWKNTFLALVPNRSILKMFRRGNGFVTAVIPATDLKEYTMMSGNCDLKQITTVALNSILDFKEPSSNEIFDETV